MYERLRSAKIPGQPALTGIHLIIKSHKRFLPRNADLKLHGNHRLTLTGYRKYVLNSGNLTHHLLSRSRYSAFHFLSTGSGKGHHDIRHGHVYLWLLFFRRYNHGKHTKNNGQQSQQGR